MFRESEICQRFYKELANNFSSLWSINTFQIEISYFYNSNLNLIGMLDRLNQIAREIGFKKWLEETSHNDHNKTTDLDW